MSLFQLHLIQKQETSFETETKIPSSLWIIKERSLPSNYYREGEAAAWAQNLLYLFFCQPAHAQLESSHVPVVVTSWELWALGEGKMDDDGPGAWAVAEGRDKGWREGKVSFLPLCNSTTWMGMTRVKSSTIKLNRLKGLDTQKEPAQWSPFKDVLFLLLYLLFHKHPAQYKQYLGPLMSNSLTRNLPTVTVFYHWQRTNFYVKPCLFL